MQRIYIANIKDLETASEWNAAFRTFEDAVAYCREPVEVIDENIVYEYQKDGHYEAYVMNADNDECLLTATVQELNVR